MRYSYEERVLVQLMLITTKNALVMIRKPAVTVQLLVNKILVYKGYSTIHLKKWWSQLVFTEL